jgi:hypothetical protein
MSKLGQKILETQQLPADPQELPKAMKAVVAEAAKRLQDISDSRGLYNETWVDAEAIQVAQMFLLVCEAVGRTDCAGAAAMIIGLGERLSGVKPTLAIMTAAAPLGLEFTAALKTRILNNDGSVNMKGLRELEEEARGKL